MHDYRDREAAYRLLAEFTESKSLIKHALTIEASMRAYAERFGADPDEWGVVGRTHRLRDRRPAAGGRCA